jgi:hypothetical protein
MKLDRTFSREIVKLANGDGSREAKLEFLAKARAARKELSTPEVMRGAFDKAIKEYGRVAVGVCLAVTIWERRDRLTSKAVQWARAVLDIWTNRPLNTMTVYIDDSALHPTKIEEYAGEFMRLTTEAE